MTIMRALGSCIIHFLVAGSLLVAGCQPRRLPEEVRQRLTTVAIVIDPAPPVVSIQGLPRSTGKGAVSGAGSAVTSFWQGCGQNVYFAFFLCVPLTPLVAIGGAIHGGAAAPPAGSVHDYEAGFISSIGGREQQELLETAVLEYAQRETRYTFRDGIKEGLPLFTSGGDYHALEAKSIDAVLVVGIEEMVIVGAKWKGPTESGVIVRARLISTRDGSELFKKDYRYFDESRSIDELSADNWAAVHAVFDKGLYMIAQRLVDDMFLTSDLPFHDVSDLPKESRKGIFPGASAKDIALLPVFKWAPFPYVSPGALADSASDERTKANEGIGDVSYDLAIYSAAPWKTDNWPTKYKQNIILAKMDQFPVFIHSDIIEPFFALEQPLKPCAEYRWGIRARYTINSLRRISPPLYYGRFKTVCN
jgi:hypothetical protein